jgi:hypothetical protein
MTATQQRYDWKDESEIKQEYFEAGYLNEAAAESENPTERGLDANTEGAVEPKKHVNSQAAASETTLWADGSKRARKKNNYNPNERLLDGRTRREKYTNLWKYNAGYDGWRAGRKSRDECHKSDENATYKRRLTETICGRADLSSTATERATDLAAHDQPRQFNFIGGICLWVLACVVVAAEEHGEDGRLENVWLSELGTAWCVSPTDCNQAVEVIEEIADGTGVGS